MKKNRNCSWVISVALVIGGVFVMAGCGSSPGSKPVDLTGVTSYYVRADGNDANAGTSEDAPFKTLTKAVEAAAKTTVKKITVIGTLNGNTVIKDADPTVNRPTISKDATDGKDIAQALAGPGVATITWSLDERDPDEILITGKPDAAGAERAVLTPAKHDSAILTIAFSTVRLEHIELSGLNQESFAVLVASGTVTLAQGAKITKNSANGLSLRAAVVIMRDDAEVSDNEVSVGAGAYLAQGSVLVMLDKALITGNKAVDGIGGGVALIGSSLLMNDSSAISGNSAGKGGGGIFTAPDTENGYISRITMSGNAVILGNTAEQGGGILLQDQLILRDKAQIIENTATNTGGGVWGETNATVTKGSDAVIANNTAPKVPDTNFTFE